MTISADVNPLESLLVAGRAASWHASNENRALISAALDVFVRAVDGAINGEPQAIDALARIRKAGVLSPTKFEASLYVTSMRFCERYFEGHAIDLMPRHDHDREAELIHVLKQQDPKFSTLRPENVLTDRGSVKNAPDFAARLIARCDAITPKPRKA